MADVSKALNIVRKLSPSGFFSRAAEEAAKIPQAKGTGEQMRAMLLKQKGVKPDELKWTGFDDWVKGKKSVTRDEISEFLEKNRVQVGETRLGVKPDAEAAARAMAKAQGNRWEDLSVAERGRYVRAADGRRITDYGDDPKFDQYTLPGGDNYGELLLTAQDPQGVFRALNQKYDDPIAELTAKRDALAAETKRIYSDPNSNSNDFARAQDYARDANGELRSLTLKRDRELAAAQQMERPYRSSHYDDDNLLAHMRMKVRTIGADPATMADIERRMAGVTDAPSTSWGSGIAELAAARGAISPEEAATYSRSKGWHNKFKDAPGLEKRVLHLEELQSDWAQAGRKQGFDTPEMRAKLKTELPEGYTVRLEDFQRTGQPERYGVFDPTGVQVATGYGRENAVNSAVNSLNDAIRGTSASPVPSAPFVDTTAKWTDLALKRAMIEAARGNYDAIAWTPGKIQAARYPGGDEAAEAKRLKGMIGYYDNLLPTQIGKVLKDINETPQFGNVSIPRGNVGASGSDIMNSLPETQGMDAAARSDWWGNLTQSARDDLFKTYREAPVDLPSFNLTPEMREKINQGLPLFTMMPAAVGLGATASQMQEGANPAEEPREGFEIGGPVDMRAGEMIGLRARLGLSPKKISDRAGPIHTDPAVAATRDAATVEAEPAVVEQALDVVRSQPAARPEPRALTVPAPRQATPEPSESQRLWQLYNESENPADFVRADEAMRAGRADGGRLLEDQYPTQYLPDVGRQVMQDGGAPEDYVSAQGRRRSTLEGLGGFEDRPVMDPETMGQNWANAVSRMRVEDYAKRPEGRSAPPRPPEQFVRPLDLDWRDKIGGAIAGDGGTVRGRVAKALVGNTGMPDTGMGFGLLDFTPFGAPLAASDVSTALKNEDYLGAALAPAGYAAYLARKPIGAAAKWTYENAIRPTYDAGRRAVDVAGDVLGRVPAPIAAGIPGIKYFDADSRSIGNGSRNLVIFDDKLIDINRRYARGGSVSHRAMMLAKELGSSPRATV
jgi:hypothetical protein